MENKRDNKSYLIPMAIIVAGVIIAGAVVYSNNSASPGGLGQAVAGSVPGEARQAPSAVENIKPVTKEDHIRGSIEAPIKIVEFSDLQCPFCKRFHETMKQALEEYGGKVAWVYRHFPLESIHSRARSAAEGSECAAELGGNDAFWAYLDQIFGESSPNGVFSLAAISVHIGLDEQKFQECLDSRRYADDVSDDLSDATNSGGRGTPYSIVITEGGQKFVISGAQPYPAVKQIIDTALGL